MATAAELALVLSAKDRASPILRKLDKTLQGVNKTSKDLSKLGVAFSAAGGGISGVALGIATKFNIMRENAQLAFETMLGSGGAAKRMMDDIQEVAKKTPFEFEDLAAASQRMLAFGFKAQDVLPTLTAIGDAVSAMGGNSDQIQRVSIAMGQMLTKGKVSAEEMMQLAEAGIPAWQLLADNIDQVLDPAAAAKFKAAQDAFSGKAFQKLVEGGMDTEAATAQAGKMTADRTMQMLMKMSESGKLDASKAIAALRKGMQSRFGGLGEKQSKTAQGAASTFADSLKAMLGDLTQGPFGEIAAMLLKIADAFDWIDKTFKDLPGPIKTVVGWFATLAVGLGAGAGLLGTIGPLLGMTGLGGLASTLGGLAGAAGPIALLVAAVAGLKLAWEKDFLGVKTLIASLFAPLGKLGKFLTDAVGGNAMAIAGALGLALGKWLLDATGFGDALAKAWAYVASLFEWLGNQAQFYLNNAWGAITGAASGLVTSVTSAVASGWATVADWFRWLGETAAYHLANAWTTVTAGVRGVVDVVSQKVYEGWGYVAGQFKWLWETAKSWVAWGVGEAYGLFAWLFGSVEGYAGKWVGTVVGFFSGLWKSAKEAVSTGVGEVYGLFAWLFGKVDGYIEAWSAFIVSKFEWVANKGKEVLGPLWELASKIGERIFGGSGPGVAPWNGGIAVPHYASGGLALSPTLAMVGDRPGGEVIMGLDQLDNYVNGGRGGGTTVVHNHYHLHPGIVTTPDVQGWWRRMQDESRARGGDR